MPIDDLSEAEEDIKTEVVAAGSSWLSLEDDAGQPQTGEEVALKKSLVVSLRNTPNKTGMTEIKEEEPSPMGDEVVGAGVDNDAQLLSNEEIEQAFYTPQQNQDFENFPAAQLGSGYGLANDNANSYQLGLSHVTPFNGDYQQSSTTTLNEHFNNSFAFDPSEGFNHHAFLQNPTVGNSGGLGGSYNGYQDDDSNGGDFAGIPYPIQTSWPSSQNVIGPSSSTSLNQTPAAPSAGGDFGGEYFNPHPNEYQVFNEHNLFDDGTFDGNLDGGWYGNGF